MSFTDDLQERNDEALAARLAPHIGAVLADHPMLVQKEVTLASWDAAGVVTGTLPEGMTPTPGAAGYVIVRRFGRRASLNVSGVTTTTGSILLPDGFRPEQAQRVPFPNSAGTTFIQGQISFTGRLYFPNSAYPAGYDFGCTWTCAPTPLPA